MNTNLSSFNDFKLRPQRGASMVEYALLVALISLVVIAGVRSVGMGLVENFLDASNAVAGAGGFQCIPTPFHPCP